MADLVPRLNPVNIEDEMKRSYMDYAMSVIIGRALPDARDGLKPAHRRVLYGMKTMGLSSTRGYRKCAKIVGEVMGNFHPHGDASIYDTLVRLAQDFNMRYPTVDGQGNFGSIDGDRPAAMRYTEARLKALADDMMTDLDKETVDFTPNYDETTEEPTVLPTPFPNLLVNGSTGIAVGMATNVPPHNLTEVIDGCIWLIQKTHLRGEMPDDEFGDRVPTRAEKLRHLIKLIPGPDFPTGGFIVGRTGSVQAYMTGRGSFMISATATTETSKKGDRISIVFTELRPNFTLTRTASDPSPIILKIPIVPAPCPCAGLPTYRTSLRFSIVIVPSTLKSGLTPGGRGSSIVTSTVTVPFITEGSTRET